MTNNQPFKVVLANGTELTGKGLYYVITDPDKNETVDLNSQVVGDPLAPVQVQAGAIGELCAADTERAQQAMTHLFATVRKQLGTELMTPILEGMIKAEDEDITGFGPDITTLAKMAAKAARDEVNRSKKSEL